VESFLYRFTFVSKAQGLNQVHLKLCMKALPRNLSMNNYYRVQMLNFVRVQVGLISFQNQYIDQLFNYYHQRNKTRIHSLNEEAAKTQKLAKDVSKNILPLRNKLTKLFKMEYILRKQEGKRKFLEQPVKA